MDIVRFFYRFFFRKASLILNFCSDPVAYSGKPANRDGIFARGSLQRGSDSCLQFKHLPEAEERGDHEDREGDVRGLGSGEGVRGVAVHARCHWGSTSSDHSGARGKPLRGWQVRCGDYDDPVISICLSQVPLPHQNLAPQC